MSIRVSVDSLSPNNKSNPNSSDSDSLKRKAPIAKLISNQVAVGGKWGTRTFAKSKFAIASDNTKDGARATESELREDSKVGVSELRDELDKFFTAQMLVGGDTSQSNSESSISGSDSPQTKFAMPVEKNCDDIVSADISENEIDESLEKKLPDFH